MAVSQTLGVYLQNIITKRIDNLNQKKEQNKHKIKNKRV